MTEIIWLRSLLAQLGWTKHSPVVLRCDKNVAIQIVNNPFFREKTKHIEIDCHYVREKLLENIVQVRHVRTGNQVPDLFTKALGSHQHYRLYGKLGMKNLFVGQEKTRQ